MTREEAETYGPYPTAPVHILDAIWEYAENRHPVGDFINAVLENDLMQAFGRADDSSLAGLFDILRYVRWEIPGNCHGSPEKVQAWLTGNEPTKADENEHYGEGGTNDHMDEVSEDDQEPEDG